MAALNFPSSPTIGDLYSANGRTYVWNGTSWTVTTAGYSGSQGFTGSKGDIGYTGSKGDTGFDGSVGFTGSKGDTGFTGSLGFTGSKGDIGFTGSLGYTGSKGDIGYTGSKGDIGYTGSKGDIGYTGSIASIPDGLIYSNQLTTTTTSANQVVDTLATATYRSVRYQVQVTSGSNYHISTIDVFHDGTTAYINEYGIAFSNTSLATFDADISAGNLRLLTTPTNASSVYKIIASAIKI